MKIICSKSNLTNGVNIVSKAVPSKTSMSILQCILIKAEDGVITFTANDTELGIETVVEGIIAEEGTVAVDAKFFSDVVRKLPDNEVEIEVDDNFVTNIKCEKVSLNLSGKDGQDFTNLPVIDKKESVTISELSLKDVIKQTIFCLSDNNTNHMMCSELFEISGDLLKVIALDGYRIAFRKVNLKNSYNDVKLIIPGKTLNEISRILSGDENKEVNIYHDKNQVLFEIENTKIVSRLVEGQYFNYEQMLNNDYETRFEVNKRYLYESIDRSTLLLREGEIKPIIMDIKDDILNISIKTMVGEMKEDIDIEKTGKDLTIAFRPKFILDVLRVLEEDNIKIYTINAKSPCIIKDDEGNYIYFILPVNFTR